MGNILADHNADSSVQRIQLTRAFSRNKNVKYSFTWPVIEILSCKNENLHGIYERSSRSPWDPPPYALEVYVVALIDNLWVLN